MAQIGDLHDGDRVSWSTPQGPATGEVLRKAICRLYIRNYEIKATARSPRFIVRDKDGKLGAHKASDLKRIES